MFDIFNHSANFQITMKTYSVLFSRFRPSAAAFFIIAAIQAANAELPSSPLGEVYTITGSETVHGEWGSAYEIVPGGVLNVLGDGATFTVSYNHNNYSTLSGDGTINIGSDTEAGRMVVTSTEPVANDGWVNIVNFGGTINVGAKGDLSISGDYPSHWGGIFTIGTLNVKGAVSVMSPSSNNSYFCVKNIALYDGGTFESALNVQTINGGVYDLYSGGMSTRRMRVNSGSFTLNLHAENVLGNVPLISFDTNTGTNFRINAYAENSFEVLEFNANSVLELSIADGATLTVGDLTTKNMASGVAGAEIVFYNYRADAFILGDSEVWIEDNRLYISSVDTYVTLTAYDGNGNLLEGEWSYDWDGEAGKLVLNVVPEPAAVAAALGALALAFALRRRIR